MIADCDASSTAYFSSIDKRAWIALATPAGAPTLTPTIFEALNGCFHGPVYTCYHRAELQQSRGKGDSSSHHVIGFACSFLFC